MLPTIEALQELYPVLNSRRIIELALHDGLLTQDEFFQCHLCLLAFGE